LRQQLSCWPSCILQGPRRNQQQREGKTCDGDNDNGDNIARENGIWRGISLVDYNGCFGFEIVGLGGRQQGI
jgi:hypothetical protein